MSRRDPGEWRAVLAISFFFGVPFGCGLAVVYVFAEQLRAAGVLR